MSRTTFDSLIQAGYSFPQETKEAKPPYAVKSTHTQQKKQLHSEAMTVFARAELALNKLHTGGRRKR